MSGSKDENSPDKEKLGLAGWGCLILIVIGGCNLFYIGATALWEERKEKREWHTLYRNDEMEIKVKLKSIKRNGNIVSFEEKVITYSNEKMKPRPAASSEVSGIDTLFNAPRDGELNPERLKARIKASSLEDKKKKPIFKYQIINRDVDCYNFLTRWWAVTYYNDAGEIVEETKTFPNWDKEEPRGGGSIYQFVCHPPAK